MNKKKYIVRYRELAEVRQRRLFKERAHTRVRQDSQRLIRELQAEAAFEQELQAVA